MFIEELGARAVPLHVHASLTGRFDRGMMSVGEEYLAQGRNGRGSRTVFLVPPKVDVRLAMVAEEEAEYTFAVTINGRTVAERGTVGPGKSRIERAYDFSAFELDLPAPAEPPVAQPAARTRFRPSYAGMIGSGTQAWR